MKRSLAACLALFGLLFPSLAYAQGLLVDTNPDSQVRLPRPIIRPRPAPPQSYKIKELAVQANLVDQVAQVQVSQSFVNTGSRQMEVSFLFPLPYDGAIDRMTLLVDGKEYPAKLLDAQEARRIYEEIVRKNRDPALLEWMGAGMFQTSVFPVPPAAERKVTLHYSQLCRKDHGLTDFLFPLSTAKYTSHPVEEVNIRLAIESSSEIKNVYSPTHAVQIERPDARHTVVQYTAKNEVPAGDFRLFYDVGSKAVGGSLLSYRPEGDEDGYFLLLATPRVKPADAPRTEKTVVFVVDRSGSMSGKKIEQARKALKFVLNNLREGDLFNIVAYDSSVESFRPELVRYDEETRAAAIGFAEGLYAGGGTNIDGALTAALAQLQDEGRPSYVIFLTDGKPTVGRTDEQQIVESARSHNRVRARVLAMGVGYDVNSRLLDRLVRANYGQSDYVRPNEDIESHVARLYSRISAPVLTDVAVRFDFDELRSDESDPINRILPKQVPDLFEGEQLVLVGRYRKAGRAKVTIAGRVGEEEQSFAFPVDLVASSADESNAFVEKLWATRRIGEIIDELDLHGKNEELVKELVALSTRHGILTPYTSFLADENARPQELARNAVQAGEALRALDRRAGRSGFAQRSEKQKLQMAARAPAASARGHARFRDAEEDREVTTERVRTVGSKSFYQRATDQAWVEPTVTEEMEKEALQVVQFSDEYFALAARHGKKISQYLIFDEPVVMNLDGTVYRIDPPRE